MSTKFVQIGVLPPFFKELWVILCEFQAVLKKSSSPEPLARKHSYLVCKVSRGLSYQFDQIRSLQPIFTILWYELHKTHFRLLMNGCTDFNKIWYTDVSKDPLTSLFKWCQYDLVSLNYANEIMTRHICGCNSV